MPIAIGVNVEDGLYVPQTNTILYQSGSVQLKTGSVTSTYDAKQTANTKIEGGGGVAGAPKKRKIGASVQTYDPEIIAAFFGGGEF